MASQGASSSSSSTRVWTYDVFLSFRGEDTRSNFTAHLYDALCRNGINTYIDDELRRAEEIAPALLKAIEESRISIVVLSKNYSSSAWCLDELMKILDCKETKRQLVFPVFYDVDASEVRHQRENVGEALAKLEDRFKDDTKLQTWKAALKTIANLSGFHLGNGIESKLIQDIVRQVLRIVNPTYLNVAKYPTGIESRVQEINLLLNVGINDVRMVGIFGEGGIGKTTIAKALYNLIACQFEYKCFLGDVRETSNREHGLLLLQETLLHEIFKDSRSLNIGNEDRGISLIKHRLCSKKFLLILDDVDRLAQLQKLVGDHSWFGPGSRIIITTRDQHLLFNHEVDSIYKVKILDDKEARELFSWNAFKRDKPIDDYEELTRHVLDYAGGLPLALTVLGSDLHGRDIRYWQDALNNYKRIPNRNIQEKLRISYNGLEENEKNIFLDVACFFKGRRVAYVTPILDGCGFSPYSGIKRLVDKCLITLEKGSKLAMHDLLQDMGREIVRQESPTDPSKRSRLWFHEDVRYVLEENAGTNKIEGILVELRPERGLISLSSKAFKKMKRLRLFINHNGWFSKGPDYLSNELRLLDWGRCPLQSLPSNFHGKELVVLEMVNSLIKELGEVPKNFENLAIMDFSSCKFLTTIPDLSGAVNLKELILRNCTNLFEVHNSIGFLDKLVELDLFECSNLRRFPRSLKLKLLATLDLRGCSSLQHFPEIECKMEFLDHLYFEDTGIAEVPSSIENLTQLIDISLVNCKDLVHIPSSVLYLQHLKGITIEDCPQLVKLPKGMKGKGESTPSNVSTNESEISLGGEVLSLPPPTNSRIGRNDGCSSIMLPAFEYLNFLNCPVCPSFEDFFSLILDNCSSTLVHLNLSGSDIISLPIQNCHELMVVEVQYCKQLQEIIGLPPNMIAVHATGCMSLESFPKVSSFVFDMAYGPFPKWIDLCDCHRVMVDIGNPVANPLRHKVRMEGLISPCGIIFAGDKIPDWFSHHKETSIGNSCEIDISGLLDLDKIIGIAVCAVVRPIVPITPKTPAQSCQLIEAEIMGNVGQRYYIGRSPELMSSDHVWLEYFVVESFKLKKDSLRVKFNSNCNTLFLKSCGVHLVHKHEQNMKDHPEVLPEDVDVHLDVLDEDIENLVSLMDGIRLTKRRPDHEDADLDSNWHPKKKKRS